MAKNTIVRFVNRKHCYKALSKKMDLRKIDNSLLAFQPDVKLYLSDNLTSYNQYLGWKWRKLKYHTNFHVITDSW